MKAYIGTIFFIGVFAFILIGWGRLYERELQQRKFGQSIVVFHEFIKSITNVLTNESNRLSWNNSVSNCQYWAIAADLEFKRLDAKLKETP